MVSALGWLLCLLPAGNAHGAGVEFGELVAAMLAALPTAAGGESAVAEPADVTAWDGLAGGGAYAFSGKNRLGESVGVVVPTVTFNKRVARQAFEAEEPATWEIRAIGSGGHVEMIIFSAATHQGVDNGRIVDSLEKSGVATQPVRCNKNPLDLQRRNGGVELAVYRLSGRGGAAAVLIVFKRFAPQFVDVEITFMPHLADFYRLCPDYGGN